MKKEETGEENQTPTHFEFFIIKIIIFIIIILTQTPSFHLAPYRSFCPARLPTGVWKQPIRLTRKGWRVALIRWKTRFSVPILSSSSRARTSFFLMHFIAINSFVRICSPSSTLKNRNHSHNYDCTLMSKCQFTYILLFFFFLVSKQIQGRSKMKRAFREEWKEWIQ